MKRRTEGPGTYRRRPVVVQAIYYDGSNVPAVLAFAGVDATSARARSSERRQALVISTGRVLAPLEVGEWLIKQDTGETYPCSEMTFSRLYEEAEE